MLKRMRGGGRGRWVRGLRGEGRESTRCRLRKRNEGGGTRPVAGCGRGMRDRGLEPLQVAEEEYGYWNSTRCRLRKRKAGCGAERRDGRNALETGAASPRPRPFYNVLYLISPILAPVPAFLFRNLQRVESQYPHSSSATCNGSSPSTRIPLPQPATVRLSPLPLQLPMPPKLPRPMPFSHRHVRYMPRRQPIPLLRREYPHHLPRNPEHETVRRDHRSL
jgi:hypothetical protein